MTRLERIIWQRAKAREAIGALRAAEEFFGAEREHGEDDDPRDYARWKDKVDELERWIFEASPIA